MAFTQSQLDALEGAIASGELSVRVGDRAVTYRSMNELLTARDVVARGLARQQGRRRRGYALADFSRA